MVQSTVRTKMAFSDQNHGYFSIYSGLYRLYYPFPLGVRMGIIIHYTGRWIQLPGFIKGLQYAIINIFHFFHMNQPGVHGISWCLDVPGS